MKEPDHLHVFRGILAACVLGVILWLLIAWAVYGIWRYCHPCEERRGGVVEQKIKDRMRYHGISVCYEDWQGNNYFIRGGKRCPL